ncbi:integrase [Gossypium australe]|uniref:Integrase n=1 Tax=Gossypium australe TaxID=47621 RepID=A0A5B6WS74_9ROSI|nr:integrase [Gossypium australe]
MYWWSGVKCEIFEFLSKCLIKVKHKVPSGLLQPVMTPEWKWERITMDFVLGLSLIPRKKNAIWVIIDRSYEIIEKISSVAYGLALPPKLEKIHNIFHVYMLMWYTYDPSYVIHSCEIELQTDFSYSKESIMILAHEVKELQNKRIPLVKILWHRHGVEEAT